MLNVKCLHVLFLLVSRCNESYSVLQQNYHKIALSYNRFLYVIFPIGILLKI